MLIRHPLSRKFHHPCICVNKWTSKSTQKEVFGRWPNKQIGCNGNSWRLLEGKPYSAILLWAGDTVWISTLATELAASDWSNSNSNSNANSSDHWHSAAAIIIFHLKLQLAIWTVTWVFDLRLIIQITASKIDKFTAMVYVVQSTSFFLLETLFHYEINNYLFSFSPNN